MTLPFFQDDSHAKFVRYLCWQSRLPLIIILYILQTAYIHLHPLPPSFAFSIPQQNPYNLLSFSQKCLNKHPLVERSLTSQDAPSRVWPSVPTVTCPPPSALTWTFVVNHPKVGPQLSSHERKCVRGSMEILISRGWARVQLH